MKLTMTSWPLFKRLMKDVADCYSQKQPTVTVSTVEMLRVLEDVRSYKEMMREYDRFFRLHKLSGFGELAERLAEIKDGR